MSDTREAPPTLDFKASLRRPLKAALLVGVVTALITLFLPNFYQSEARLLPSDSNAPSGISGLAAAAAAFGVNVGGGSSDANFVDILNSRWLKENLLNTEFRFHGRAWRFGSQQFYQMPLVSYLKAKNMDRAVRQLDSILTTSKDAKSNIITLRAETLSPELSQEIVNRAVELLNQFVVKNNRTHGSEKAAFADSRLSDARREMAKAEAGFLAFLESNRNYQMSGDPAVRLKGARLDAELNLRRQVVASLAMSREQALLEAKNDVPILNVLDPGNLPIEKSRPSRAAIVLMYVLMAGVACWVFENRNWLRAGLLGDPEGTLNHHMEQ